MRKPWQFRLYWYAFGGLGLVVITVFGWNQWEAGHLSGSPFTPSSVQAAALNMPVMHIADLPTTSSNEPNTIEALKAELIQDIQAEHEPVLQLPPMPQTFTPQWATLDLDKQRIQLHVLTQGYPLTDTWQQSGMEAFEYNAYLFDQMAIQVDDPLLAQHLKNLSLQSQELALHLRKATKTRFDGPPTADLNHLKVRADILEPLQELIENPQEMLDLNQNGIPFPQKYPSKYSKTIPGPGIQKLEATLAQMEKLPTSHKYPETMKLVRSQVNAMRVLAQQMTLQWESYFACSQTERSRCGNRVVRMKIYAQQTASSDQFTLATAPWIETFLKYPQAG